MARKLTLCLLPLVLSSSLYAATTPAGGFYTQGVDLYKAGRNSDAVDSFEQAIKHKESVPMAQEYIDRIRKETVERIRNKALTGVNKANWQTKYYFMNEVDGRIRVGISVQELFERESTNFRPGAVEALNQVASIIAKAESSRFDVEMINEVNPENAPSNALTAQQITTVFSYLSLASRDVLPKF